MPLEVASMLITLANSDEQWKWGKYAVALPVSKKQIVSSRYAFAGIAASVGFCVSLAVNMMSYVFFPAYQFGFYLFIAIASFCAVLLFLAFILPSNYWMGSQCGVRSDVYNDYTVGYFRNLVKNDKQCNYRIYRK